MNRVNKAFLALRGFIVDTRAAITVELVLVLPMLLWAFFATMIFNDAYRARTQAQAAALHVADAISRNTTILTTQYLEGMNDVYDFLTGGEQMSRLRITSVVWDRDADQPLVLWSYGTRGMTALPSNTFQLMSADELGTLRELMDGADGENMLAGFTQMPNVDLHNRIPPVMPGEALILVESFTMWETPMRGVFLGFDVLENTRLSPIAVVRPRFTPFINFEGAIDAVPPDYSEFDGTPSDPVTDPVTDPDPDPTDPTDPPLDLVVLDVDFSNGDADGWSEDKVTTSSDGTIGGFLGPFGGETHNQPLKLKVDLDDKSVEARIEFDLYLLDSWDGFDPVFAPEGGEQLWIGVEGTSISAEVFQVSPSGIMRATRGTIAPRKEGLFKTRMELVSENANIGGAAWPDQIWRVTINIDDPKKKFDLEFRMLSDEPVSNESFGIDNLRISATRGEPLKGVHEPSQNDDGEDPFSGFQNYEGCPDPRLGARTHHVLQSALAASGSVLRHRVDAGGDQNLTRCNHFDRDDEGYVNANPTVVFQWDNEGQSGAGNRLRIRTDDGNNGFDCDAVLAIRDPGGQWFYSGWTIWEGGRNDDWNALLDMRNAQSGAYHVFVGNWYRGLCETDIVFERY